MDKVQAKGSTKDDLIITSKIAKNFIDAGADVNGLNFVNMTLVWL